MWTLHLTSTSTHTSVFHLQKKKNNSKSSSYSWQLSFDKIKPDALSNIQQTYVFCVFSPWSLHRNSHLHLWDFDGNLRGPNPPMPPAPTQEIAGLIEGLLSTIFLSGLISKVSFGGVPLDSHDFQACLRLQNPLNPAFVSCKSQSHQDGEVQKSKDTWLSTPTHNCKSLLFFIWLVLNPHLVATLCSSFSREHGHPLLMQAHHDSHSPVMFFLPVYIWCILQETPNSWLPGSPSMANIQQSLPYQRFRCTSLAQIYVKSQKRWFNPFWPTFIDIHHILSPSRVKFPENQRNMTCEFTIPWGREKLDISFKGFNDKQVPLECVDINIYIYIFLYTHCFMFFSIAFTLRDLSLENSFIYLLRTGIEVSPRALMIW